MTKNNKNKFRTFSFDDFEVGKLYKFKKSKHGVLITLNIDNLNSLKKSHKKIPHKLYAEKISTGVIGETKENDILLCLGKFIYVAPSYGDPLNAPGKEHNFPYFLYNGSYVLIPEFCRVNSLFKEVS